MDYSIFFTDGENRIVFSSADPLKIIQKLKLLDHDLHHVTQFEETEDGTMIERYHPEDFIEEFS